MSKAFEWLPGWKAEGERTTPVRVLGIDLGTTNSTVTEIIWDPNSEEPPVASLLDIPQATVQGEITKDLLPSVVAILDGKEYVGEGAHRLRSSTEHTMNRGANIWWESKNHIGTRLQWIAAPEGYKTPRDIAARILHCLNEAALDASDLPVDKIVVTVPASFQLTQRQDTIAAAKSAGIMLQGQDLFDEPVAAFLDYLVDSGGSLVAGRKRSRIMVVDFGGGTCDVALLQVNAGEGGELDVSRRGVSRFHRIGGSDIDESIAVQILLPKLMEENGIATFELTYKQKRDFVIPALASLAEQLKKKLSDLVHYQIQMGTFNEQNESIKVTLPVAQKIATGNQDIGIATLSNPELTLKELRTATDQFLNPVAIAPMRSEYFEVTSIFAPIRDVLSRAEWTPMHIDSVLLVGGASLDYSVGRALAQYFPDSNILTYQNRLDSQRCVGRGAAYQALLLAVFGKSPLRATIGDAVSVQTTNGPQEMIPENSTLPYPADGEWIEVPGLSMSRGCDLGSVDLAIEIQSGNRTLYSQSCAVSAPVAVGDPISLKLKVDDNQRMLISLTVDAQSGPQPFDVDLDNPFSVTANPNSDRDRILEIESQIPGGPLDTQIKLIVEMSNLHINLKEYERARQLLEGILPSVSGNEQVQLLSNLGSLCGQMGDSEAQQLYLEQAAFAGSSQAAFNLAMALRQSDPGKALIFVDRRIEITQDCAGHSLRGIILKNLKRQDEAVTAWLTAFSLAPNLKELSDFELAWLSKAAAGLEERMLMKAIAEEQKRRKDLPGSSEGARQEPTAAALPAWDS
jgi:molecular chaperone DnaK